MFPFNPRLNQALEFAAKAHQSQVRKGTDIPYISHPVAVAWILQDAGCEEDLIIAGLLHDVTEDAKVPVEVLRERFGARVAGVVAPCSDPDKSLPWIVRKEHTIRQLMQSNDDVLAVAAADKLHNAQCMLADLKVVGDALWSRFKQGLHHQAWYYGSVSHAILTAAKGETAKAIWQQLHRTLEELFGEDFYIRWQVHPDRRRFIQLSRSAAEQKRRQPPSAGDWLLAINPETLEAKFVVRELNGYVSQVEGHEDLFPLGMIFKHADGFLPGGDWLVASTPERRVHDGRYRSYFITWIA
jgi:hypothetical protein